MGKLALLMQLLHWKQSSWHYQVILIIFLPSLQHTISDIVASYPSPGYASIFSRAFQHSWLHPDVNSGVAWDWLIV
jgi:hypothetical protein